METHREEARADTAALRDGLSTITSALINRGAGA
jgi:hypothetical protein